MATIDKIKAKIEQKIPLTQAERSLLIVHQQTSYQPKARQKTYEKELLTLILQDPDITPEERELLSEELSKL